jgi:hypothetical protein
VIINERVIIVKVAVSVDCLCANDVLSFHHVTCGQLYARYDDYELVLSCHYQKMTIADSLYIDILKCKVSSVVCL